MRYATWVGAARRISASSYRPTAELSDLAHHPGQPSSMPQSGHHH